MPLRRSSSSFSPFLRNLFSSDDVDDDDDDDDDNYDDDGDDDIDDYVHGDNDDDSDDYEPFQLCHWDTREPGC